MGVKAAHPHATFDFMTNATAIQRRPARHEEIVAAARALAVEEGWRAVSVRRIAARVGCCAAAIYQYLPDKESILKAIAEDGERRLAEAMAAAVADVGGAGKRMRAAARAHDRFVAENPALYRVLHGLDGVPRAGGGSGPVRALLRELAAMLVKKHGLTAPADDVADAFAATLHGFAAAGLDGHLGDRQRMQALLAGTVDDLLRGLGRR